MYFYRFRSRWYVPGLLFTEWENSMVNCLIILKLPGCHVTKAVVSSKVRDSLVVLLSKDRIAYYMPQLGLHN